MVTRARAHAGCSGHGLFVVNLITGEVLPVNGVASSNVNVLVRPVNAEITVVVEISNGQQF
jgi:hypothetical protein